MVRAFPSAVIENLQPLIDGGRYAIKRVIGEDLVVEIAQMVRTGALEEVDSLVHSGELEVLMASYPDRSGATQWAPPARVVVDRLEARTAAWYEFFPRSAEGKGDEGSKLRDCLPR